MSFKTKRAFLCIAHFTMFICFDANGQKIAHKAVTSDTTVTADSVWRTLPKGCPFLQVTFKIIFSSEEVRQNKKLAISRYICYETYAQNLWNWGINFWKEFPLDKRRFDWFLVSLANSPYYFGNVEVGVENEINGNYRSEFNWKRRNQYRDQYKIFRSEFMKSQQVTKAQRLQLLFLELMQERNQNLWSNLRINGKWDYGSWVKRAINYSIAFYKENPKIDSSGFSDDPLPNQLIFNTVGERKGLGLSNLELKDFVRLFKHSGVKKLEIEAEKCWPLVVLFGNPIQIKDTTVDGKSISLDKLKGKIVLLDFWNIHCTSCVHEMPGIKAVYDKYKAKGFEVVSLCGAEGGDDNEKSKRRALQIDSILNAQWPLIFLNKDKYEKMIKTYGFTGLSQMLLLDQKGRLIMYNDQLPHMLESLVVELLEHPNL